MCTVFSTAGSKNINPSSFREAVEVGNVKFAGYAEHCLTIRLHFCKSQKLFEPNAVGFGSQYFSFLSVQRTGLGWGPMKSGCSILLGFLVTKHQLMGHKEKIFYFWLTNTCSNDQNLSLSLIY